MSATSSRLASVAGLALGPVCWAVSTQAAEVVAFLDCDRQRLILAPLGLALAAIAAAAGVASLIAAPASGREWLDHAGGRAGRLLGAVSFVAGLLFAVVIADQLAATMIVARCAR